MRGRKATLALGLTALALCAGPGEALAGGLGSWSRVTPEGDDDILTDVNVVRAGANEVHMVYRVRDAADPLKKDLVYARLRAGDGTTLTRTTVIDNWNAINNPAIVQQPNGSLRVVSSGLRSSATADPYSAGDLYSATGDASGSAWTLEPGALSPRSAYVSTAVGVTTAGDGTLVSAFAPGEVVATIGTGGGDAADRVFQPGCCGYAAKWPVTAAPPAWCWAGSPTLPARTESSSRTSTQATGPRSTCPARPTSRGATRRLRSPIASR